MGNDDLLLQGAIDRISACIEDYPDIAVISRAYGWFLDTPDNVRDTVRHLGADQHFPPGPEAIQFFFRRMGVLSGLVFKRLESLKLATDKYDGHLYYQMHLAGNLLKTHSGYYISEPQTASRDEIQPDFGNAENEQGTFRPGSFNYQSRIYMVEGLLRIADGLDDDRTNRPIYHAIRNDIGSYFYPYIRDQLNLPLTTYIRMEKEFQNIGMNNHKLFLTHIVLGYLFKKRGYDFVIKSIRRILGRSPRLG